LILVFFLQNDFIFFNFYVQIKSINLSTSGITSTNLFIMLFLYLHSPWFALYYYFTRICNIILHTTWGHMTWTRSINTSSHQVKHSSKATQVKFINIFFYTLFSCFLYYFSINTLLSPSTFTKLVSK